MGKNKQKKLSKKLIETRRPIPMQQPENIELEGNVNGVAFQDAITITDYDRLTYYALGSFTDDETISYVATPLMSKAKCVVEDEQEKYNSGNILRFLADLENKDVELIKNKSQDSELTGSYIVNRANAFYSSIYVDIYTDLSIAFSTFLESIDEIIKRKRQKDDYELYNCIDFNLRNYIFGSFTSDRIMSERICYDKNRRGDKVNDRESIVDSLTAQIIRYSIGAATLNDDLDLLFFTNTVLPNYMNEIIYLIRNTLARSHCTLGRHDKKSISNDIINTLLPILHNIIIQIYSKYVNILSKEDIVNLITAENINGVDVIISPEDKSSGMIATYNLYNEVR